MASEHEFFEYARKKEYNHDINGKYIEKKARINILKSWLQVPQEFSKRMIFSANERKNKGVVSRSLIKLRTLMLTNNG